jgi:Flp pilus assembly protein TadG
MTPSVAFLRGSRGGTRCRHVRRARLAGERGQATVEFAFLLPLVVFAALAVVQIGLVVRDQLGVVHAAREAARAASVDREPGAALRAARRTLPRADVEVGPRPRVGGDITVTVRYHSVTDLPLVGALFPDPDLHASATMRVER